MYTAVAARAWRGAVMQQHLRKACGGKFKFFCPVGGKTSWLAKPSHHHCHSLAELLLAANALLLLPPRRTPSLRRRRATAIPVAPETG